MTPRDIHTWLTTTLPGIVLLGAAGSLLAIPIARLLRWLFVRALGNVLLSHIRPYLLARILTRKYLVQRDTPRLTFWIAIVAGGFFASSILLFALAAAASLYFVAFGIQNTRVTVAIAVALGVLFTIWLRDALGLTGLFKELLQNDMASIGEAIKKPGMAVHALAHFEELFASGSTATTSSSTNAAEAHAPKQIDSPRKGA